VAPQVQLSCDKAIFLSRFPITAMSVGMNVCVCAVRHAFSYHLSICALLPSVHRTRCLHPLLLTAKALYSGICSSGLSSRESAVRRRGPTHTHPAQLASEHMTSASGVPGKEHRHANQVFNMRLVALWLGLLACLDSGGGMLCRARRKYGRERSPFPLSRFRYLPRYISGVMCGTRNQEGALQMARKTTTSDSVLPGPD
jgi:hypothetical protein